MHTHRAEINLYPTGSERGQRLSLQNRASGVGAATQARCQGHDAPPPTLSSTVYCRLTWTVIRKDAPYHLASTQMTGIGVCHGKIAQNSYFPSQPAHQTVMASNKGSVFCHFNELGLSFNELLELVLTSCSCNDSL